LAKRKAKCGHGNWLPWLNANVEFTAVTAGNYIRLFENAEWLKSKNVFDLTDARLKLREKSKAEGVKPRGRGASKPPEGRSFGTTHDAISRLHALWYRNDNGRTLPMRDGDLEQWVEKVEVSSGETAETIAQEAFRLWKLSVPTRDPPADDLSPKDPTYVQEPDQTSKSQEYYLLQTLGGVTIYLTEANEYNFNLEARGLPLWTCKYSDLLRDVEKEQCQVRI
jgi:hypothetical protein